MGGGSRRASHSYVYWAHAELVDGLEQVENYDIFAACIHRLEHIARKAPAEIAGQYSAAVGATRSLIDESSTAVAKRMGLTGMPLANGASAAESWDWMACTMSSAPACRAPTRTRRWLRRSI